MKKANPDIKKYFFISIAQELFGGL